MKKHLCTLLVSFALLHSLSSYAQEAKNNAVKFNVFGLFGGQYQLAYERGLGEKFSVQLNAGFISYKSSQTFNANSYKSKTNGVIIVPEARYYFKQKLKGPYLAAFARFRNVTEKLTDTSVPIGTDVSRTTKVNTAGGGVLFGYQGVIEDILLIDVFIGPQFKSRSSSDTYANAGVTQSDFNSKFLDIKIKDKSGVGVRFGVNVGIVF